ncbi:MAG TPA: serine hydrolase domain-containing protein [Blastocatellia bacterium]|nr:serine hydrolase domain-containing protein [Blastocatellia bacterium]HMY76431.1 serine hydrolase domain-containing protein [Blastocatellia bacterium]HMZ20296.1 serine hydrolase domain-containing protein [Blastocatellia bacterium]HNG28783.1 serine hydrolase domain-containing protein [Blastocatellia bacterium]
MKRLLFSSLALMLALAVNPIFVPRTGKANSDPPVVAPETVGLSANRLANIRALMNNHVAAKHIPGASALIARKGKIAYAEAFGMADVETGRPMKMDTIHRIYSMTKPITSVALMMLYEEGKFQLNDPVAKYLPEFAKMQVAIEEKDPQTGKPVMKTVPAKRPITVRDLMRHTAGLTYGVFGDTLVDREYRKAKILGQLNLADFVSDLAKIPLQYEPGTRWHYSVSVDVQGRLIEVLSGKSFDQFLQERVFTPLEMNDTAFVVSANKKDRFAKLYTITKEGKLAPSPTCATRQECYDGFPNSVPDLLSSQGMLSGGGGLTSTAYDYLHFCRMLLDNGQYNGKRLLSRKTVQLMSSDHLGGIPGMSAGNGFGLGFAVSKAPGEAGMMGSPGEYNWGGAAGTKFWIDPQEQLIGIFMIQILPHTGLEYGSEFRVMTYQSIAD